MANKFLSKLGSSIAKNKALPGRLELLKTAAKNPKAFAQTLRDLDRTAVAAGKAKTGKGRWGQAGAAAKRAAKTDAAKDLAVNTGGALGSAIGGSVGGVPGALAGDNVGALVTRKAVNKGYANRRARKRLGANATPAQVKNRAKRTYKAIERLEKRKGAYLQDQIGWGVGNAAAAATPGVGIPLRGGAVAARTVPQVARNIKKVKAGKLSKKDFVRQTLKDIKEDNNIKRAIQKGNARERLLRQKLNKKIRESGLFRSFRRRLAYFSSTGDRARWQNEYVALRRRPKLLSRLR